MGRAWSRFGTAAVVVLLALFMVVATGAASSAAVAPDSAAAGHPGADVRIGATDQLSSSNGAAGTAWATLSGVAPASTSGPDSAPSSGPARRWIWPLQPQPQVLVRFDPPDVAWGAGHRGVDLAATVGQVVVSPADGVVTFSGVVVDRGIVVVTMPSGLRATFEPVEAGPPTGTVVTAGGPVGLVAATPGHCAPLTCLHWGVLRDDTYLDPLALVGSTRVILLPLLPRSPP